MANFIIPTIIYLFVPCAGLMGYLRLRKRMLAEAIPDPPVVAFFIVFVSYGSWLLFLLTELFWFASGLATVGLFYLTFVAPIVMLVLAIYLYQNRHLSSFHRGAFVACAGYFIFPLTLLLLHDTFDAKYGQ